jgi:hypothetical protein
VRIYAHPGKRIEFTSDGVPCFGIYTDGCFDFNRQHVDTAYVPMVEQGLTPYEAAEKYWTPAVIANNVEYASAEKRLGIFQSFYRQLAHTATQIHIQWADKAGPDAHQPVK